MINLLGNNNSRSIIKKELEEAGIVFALENEKFGELQTDIVGYFLFKKKLIKFNRGARYWCISGLIPLEIAKKIHSKLNKEIRVEGNAEWNEYLDDSWPAIYYNEEGKELIAKKDKDISGNIYLQFKQFTRPQNLLFVDDPSAHGKPYITSYHIDSQKALNLFVEILHNENS